MYLNMQEVNNVSSVTGLPKTEIANLVVRLFETTQPESLFKLENLERASQLSAIDALIFREATKDSDKETPLGIERDEFVKDVLYKMSVENV